MSKQDIANRFEIFVNSFNISQKEFAEILNVPSPYIYKLKKGELSFELYSEKLNQLGLNLNWLYTGKGGMTIDNETNKEIFHQNFKISEINGFEVDSKYYKDEIFLRYLDIYKYFKSINEVKIFHLEDMNHSKINLVIGVRCLNLELIKTPKYAIHQRILMEKNWDKGIERQLSTAKIGIITNSKNENGKIISFDFTEINNQNISIKVDTLKQYDYYYIVGNLTNEKEF